MTSVLVVYRDGVLVPEADLALLEDGTSFVVQIPEALASPISAADAKGVARPAADTDELEFFHWLDGKWGTLSSDESQRIIDNDEWLAWSEQQSRASNTWLL